MIRILAVAASAVLAYPLFSMLTGSGTPTAEAVKIVVFPILTGAAAAIVNRKKEPLAASALAAAVSVAVVGAGAVIGQLFWEEAGRSAAGLAAGYSARSIIAFFFGVAGGAVVIFFASFGKRPGKAVEPKSYKFSIIAGIVMIALWGCYGISMLVENSQQPATTLIYKPLESDAAVAECIAALRSGTIAKMDAARFALADREEAVEPVIACLADDRARVQYYAVKILGDLGDPRAIEPLQKLLENLPSNQNAYGADQEAILAAELPAAIKTTLQKIKNGQ